MADSNTSHNNASSNRENDSSRGSTPSSEMGSGRGCDSDKISTGYDHPYGGGDDGDGPGSDFHSLT